MNQFCATLLAIAAVAALAACGGGAREVELTPQRGISADIAAARDRGPTAAEPGIVAREEPVGAIPWHSHDRHPN